MIGIADIKGFMEMEQFFRQQQQAMLEAGIEVAESAVETTVGLTNISVQAGLDLSETMTHAGMGLAGEVLNLQKKAVDYLYSDQPSMAAAEGIKVIQAALAPFQPRVVPNDLSATEMNAPRKRKSA